MITKTRNIRVTAVGLVFVLATLVIWVRLVQVQIFAHDFYKEKARRQWTLTRDIPAVRGAIFDRQGRPLALSVRSYSVCLNPEWLEDPQRVVRLMSRILEVSPGSLWKRLRSKKGFLCIKRRCNLSPEQRDLLRSLRGVDVREVADRIYPYGTVGAKLVGFVGQDNRGMAGIEAAFDEELAGKPGWEELQRDGRYRAHGYYKYPRIEPRDGKQVYLTIDASIQEIAEEELRGAIVESGARWGSIILEDCRTGEILALAEYPSTLSRDFASLVDSLWTIRSISWVYEPGSTFKLITAAALLETGRISPSDVVYGEKGRADLGFARITDAHPYGDLTFREAFVHSSNIVMAKASLRLTPREFYKFIRLFGFGAKTGIELLGESPGCVSPVEKWSERTQATMAFGQEIAVTPLQMLSAFSAVANGGVLLAPTVLRALGEEKPGVERIPVRVRSVVSKATASTLRSFCRDVVGEGTGSGAALSFLEVSGKTGTGQKASPRGGYKKGKSVASFIGFAPSHDPRITCLVLLDEPDSQKRFGGVSAAPVFAKVMRGVANSTGFLDEDLVSVVVDSYNRGRERGLRAPNFLRMSVEEAVSRAEELGLRLRYSDGGGWVVAQDPDPGVSMARGGVVRIIVKRGERSVVVPDLLGLSIREAKRRAVALGWGFSFRGVGVVESQEPPPGARSISGTLKLFCRD